MKCNGSGEGGDEGGEGGENEIGPADVAAVAVDSNEGGWVSRVIACFFIGFDAFPFYRKFFSLHCV